MVALLLLVVLVSTHAQAVMCAEQKERTNDIKEDLQAIMDFLQPNEANDYLDNLDDLEPNEARQYKRSPWWNVRLPIKIPTKCAHNCWHNNWRHRDNRARGANLYHRRCSYSYIWGGRCYCYGPPKCR